ncbi:MAG: enoyl-CoA hydratase-related protein [Acidimicrobiia bacterium]
MAEATSVAPEGPVRCQVADGVATVTLYAPERRNALDLAMVDAIGEVFDRVEADPGVGAVVVTGAPPAFCAGAALGGMGSFSRESLLRVYEGFLRVGRCPLPTLAAVNGAAVGAGMNLALCCDVRLAARGARFDTRFMALGIHPGGGHVWLSRQAAGAQTVNATVLFGEVLDGAGAERCGLAWRCVGDDELLAEAHTMAARAASAPRQLLVRTKATIAAMAAVTDHEAAVERELDPQLWSLAQPDFEERLAGLRRRISSSAP